jgi:hypothetical protein
MGKAFEWLDRHMTEALDAPDEHFDWIWMAKDDDWKALVAAFPGRDDEWREALAYLASDGPPVWCYRVLAVALRDETPAVREQAALSFVDLFEMNEEEGASEVDDAMWALVETVAQNAGSELDDVRAFLARRAAGD